MAGPVCVLLAGVVGVMLSTLATSAAVAPMALVGLGMLTFAGAVNTSATWRWFGLLAFENENAAPLPAALVHRPSLAHLAWLAALVVLLGAAAVLRAGGRGTVLRVTTALALVAALVAGFTQTRGLSAADKDQVSAYTDHPAAHQRCTTEKGLTICAFPEFAPWTSQWAKVARGSSRTRPARWPVRRTRSGSGSSRREARAATDSPAADGMGRRRRAGRHPEGGDGRHGLE